MVYCTFYSDGDRNVFNLEHNDDGRWLNANNGHPDNGWNDNDRWVFVRSKLSHFSPALLVRRVLFSKLTIPTT